MPVSAAHTAISVANRGHVKSNSTQAASVQQSQPVVEKHPEGFGAAVAALVFIGLVAVIFILTIEGLRQPSDKEKK